MIKRANKITALLLSAAAVISLVPATGVNAAEVKRIESEDGTVYGAVAFKDGKFLIDGEIDGKDEGVYFLNGGKYTELDDLDTGSEYGIYGEKYATVDGDDYYVDLSSGKVTDDSIAEDDADDAASALRKKIRKDDDGRFTKTSTSTATSGYDDLPTVAEIPGAKFGETWYEASYTLKTTDSAVSVYTDSKGSYIDADYNVGKIKIKTTDASVSTSSATLENTVDTENFGNGKADVKVSNATVLGQDKNYIYRLVTITINAENAISEVNGKSGAGLDGIGTNKVSYRAIQKISKAQSSDDIDGIKFAKSVTTYALTDEDAKVAEGTNVIDADKTEYSVVNGKIIAYNTGVSNSDVTVRTISLKAKAGYNYTDIADESEESFDAIDIDVDGNLWRLDSGNIYKFDNDEDWDKVYKVDGSMENFTIYDKDNFVVWNEDDEVYSIVGGKKASNEEDNKEEVKTGWVQSSNGWSFVKADGTKATGWLDDNGTWYYLDAAGNMQTGWLNDNGNWFYLNPISDGTRGAMKTGWVNVNGTWFYLNPISDGTRGAMKTGWQYINGSWYYLNPVSDGTRGAMKTGWLNDNGTWYYLQSNGAMAANTTIDGYRLGSNGAWIR